MAVWCPKCGSEYIEGWGDCSKCGIPLVAERPATLTQPAEPPAPSVSFIEPGGGGEHDDPFVAVWEGPTPQGMSLTARLEEAHIPFDTDDSYEAGRMRLVVPASYVPEAKGVLESPFLPAAPPDPWTQADDEPLAGSPSAIKIVFACVALLLIAVLVLSRV